MFQIKNPFIKISNLDQTDFTFWAGMVKGIVVFKFNIVQKHNKHLIIDDMASVSKASKFVRSFLLSKHRHI